MNPAPLAEEDTRRADDEGSAAAALAVALALARDALTANYPDEPDPLCPRIYAVDVVLHHIDGLSDALARHRAVLDGDHRLPIHTD